MIGFTAEPDEYNSSRFSSDLARRLPIPIFHVNAEDADAVLRVAALAVEYRYQFHTDVVIDLIGYRRHGHSEVDDPTDYPAAALRENQAPSAAVRNLCAENRRRSGRARAQTRRRSLKRS